MSLSQWMSLFLKQNNFLSIHSLQGKEALEAEYLSWSLPYMSLQDVQELSDEVTTSGTK